MSERDELRRRALEERIRLAEQDIGDLAQQVEDGELDDSTAAELEARYRADLDAARKELGGMPKAGRPAERPSKRRADDAPKTSASSSKPGRPTGLIIGLAAAAMVVATVVIVVLATGGDDAPAMTTVPAAVGGGSLAELEAAVAAQPENTAMRLALAQLYFDEGDYMNAMNQYSTVTAGNPTATEAATANAHIGWMAWVALNDPETAITFLNSALEDDPGYGEAVLWKGVVLLYGMEDGAAAVPLFEQVLQLPDLPEAIRPDVEALLAEAQGGTP